MVWVPFWLSVRFPGSEKYRHRYISLPLRERFRSVRGHDVIHRLAVQVHLGGNGPDAFACLVEFLDALPVDDHPGPAERFALLSGTVEPGINTLDDQVFQTPRTQPTC